MAWKYKNFMGFVDTPEKMKTINHSFVFIGSFVVGIRIIFRGNSSNNIAQVMRMYQIYRGTIFLGVLLWQPTGNSFVKFNARNRLFIPIPLRC